MKKIGNIVFLICFLIVKEIFSIDIVVDSSKSLISPYIYGINFNPGDIKIISLRWGGNRTTVIVPMAGYVARDANDTVTEEETAPNDRWDKVEPFKNVPLSLELDLNDGVVYVDEEVNFLANKYVKSNFEYGLRKK